MCSEWRCWCSGQIGLALALGLGAEAEGGGRGSRARRIDADAGADAALMAMRPCLSLALMTDEGAAAAVSSVCMCHSQ